MAEAGDKSGLDAEGAKATYDRLVNDRAPYVTRAESCAALTIPSVFPKDSDNGSTNFVTPYQSVGARGLNNLASKLLLTQFPVGEPFFKLNINEFALKQVGDMTIVQQAAVGLSMVERVAMRYMEGAAYRPTLFETMKQLLVTGNGLLYLPPGEQALKLYRLSAYVVERDTVGQVLQVVTKDNVAVITLPDEIRTEIDMAGPDVLTERVDVYTHCYRDHEADRWLSYQEINGVLIESSSNNFPIDASPYIPVRLYKVDGESYGRSYVEEYIGDLTSLENLSKSIVDMAAACSKILFLVKPTGTTQVRRLQKAANGSFVAGNKADIEVFQVEKYADFQVAKATADGLEQRLAMAFLLNSAVQRNAERVTAEEVRFVANELEATLGGVYSVLSNEFQLPLVRRLLVELQIAQKIPDLPQEAMEPSVITGMDAIGRGQDLMKLQTWGALMAPAMQFLQGKISWEAYAERVTDASGLDPAGLILTEQEQQAQAQQNMAQAGVVSAAEAAGKAAGTNMGAAGTEDTAAMAAAVQQAQQ